MIFNHVLLSLFVITTSVVVTAENVPHHIGDMGNDDLEKTLLTSFEDFFKNEAQDKLIEVLSEIRMSHLFHRDSALLEIRESIICVTCRTLTRILITTRRQGVSRNTIFNFLSTVCIGLDISTKTVCDGTIERILDTVLYIIDNGKDVTPEWACSVLFQDQNCESPAGRDWEIRVDDGYSVKELEQPSSETRKILHISDLHYDEEYVPGANADCDLPLCCGLDGGNPINSTATAGYWGDYRNCDSPWHAIVNTFRHIKDNHDFTSVYFTGDIIHHRLWKTEKGTNINDIRKIYKLIDDVFGHVPIFPVLGNHEPHPLNLFSPHDVSENVNMQWIFDVAAEEWRRWLPPSTEETIRKGGYYTVKVNEKLRIIALNTNVCYTINLWLIYDPVDMYQQLQWFRDVLAQAEASGEAVHIISHVPTGASQCYKTWAREYRKIINRYGNTVKAIFNGHTHTSEFRLFYNTSDIAQPVTVAFSGGSITTYTKLNSNYMLYEINSGTEAVTDVEYYTFNLTEANLAGPHVEPNWYKLYSFKNVYNLDDMSPQSLNELVQTISADKSVAQTYYRNKYKNSDPYVNKKCDNECLFKDVCEIVTSLYNDNTQCNILKTIWDSS